MSDNINDADIEYIIVAKKREDIISELTDDPRERLIYDSIIEGIERNASEAIKANKIAQLPAIGCVRINPIKKVIKDNRLNFSIAKKAMNADQYKEHVRETVIHAKEKQLVTERKKLIIKQTRSRNRAKYDELYIKLGKTYAEFYIQSLLMFVEIPFNVDVQNHFDDLNNL